LILFYWILINSLFFGKYEDYWVSNCDNAFVNES